MKILNQVWSVQRILFTILGTAMIFQSIIENQWFGLLFGLYFTSMGILNFGCAAGACAPKPDISSRNDETKEIEFEEIK